MRPSYCGAAASRAFASCWKYTGEGNEPEMLKEALDYEFVHRQQRNYKS